MEDQHSRQDQQKKVEWGMRQFLLPAIGTVVVMIVTQITQIYTNDWTKSQKLYFNIGIGVLYLFVVAVFALVTAVCNAHSKGKEIAIASRNINETLENIKFAKPMFEQLDNDIKDFSKYTSELIKSNDLFQYILDGKLVVDLESSVGNYNKRYEDELDIYIQSSDFILEESGDLFEAIMWNLRKGVHYVYMIPNDKIEKYKKMLRHWFRAFSCICVSKDEYDKFQSIYDSYEFMQYTEYWCDEYNKIYNDANVLWMKADSNDAELLELRRRCEQLFKELIATYVEDPSLFFVTIALYEVKESTWEAIVKLPTRDIKEEYYAFRIPGGSSGISKKSFVDTFKSYYKDAKKYRIDFEKEIFKWRD